MSDDPNRYDSNELGREFNDPNAGERRKLANSFADPNSLDDGRLGKSFMETNSSRKRRHAHHPHKPKNYRTPLYVAIGMVVLFLIVLLVGWLPRHKRNKELEKRANEQKNEKPTVEVATVHPSSQAAGLAMPGTTIPLTEAYVYARANGYLKTRYVDIGDHVRRGQVLAVIDSPDLDAQVEQAREQLRQAEQQLAQQKSQLALATVTVARYRVLVQKGVFSRQDGDTQEANYASATANVAAADRNVEAFRENLNHVLVLQDYEQVRAPFSGVITQRNVDVGALISGPASGAPTSPPPAGQTSSSGGSQQAGEANNSGSSGSVSSAATPAQSPGQGGALFGIAQVERLRVLVSVPEGYAPAIHPGSHARLQFQEYPASPFLGDITRTSDSIDPNTRTLLTEVQVDNQDGKLYPGMYTVVTFPPAPGFVAPITITGDAVVVRHDQSMVATVVNGKVHFVPVVIGRDFGGSIEIASGLKNGDVIVTNVTDDASEGREVQAKQTKQPELAPASAPSQSVPPGGSTQYGNPGLTDQNLQGAQQQQNQKANGQKGNVNQQQKKTESHP